MVVTGAAAAAAAQVVASASAAIRKDISFMSADTGGLPLPLRLSRRRFLLVLVFGAAQQPAEALLDRLLGVARGALRVLEDSAERLARLAGDFLGDVAADLVELLVHRRADLGL